MASLYIHCVSATVVVHVATIYLKITTLHTVYNAKNKQHSVLFSRKCKPITMKLVSSYFPHHNIPRIGNFFKKEMVEAWQDSNLEYLILSPLLQPSLLR